LDKSCCYFEVSGGGGNSRGNGSFEISCWDGSFEISCCNFEVSCGGGNSQGDFAVSHCGGPFEVSPTLSKTLAAILNYLVVVVVALSKSLAAVTLWKSLMEVVLWKSLAVAVLLKFLL
jgi:hypothetical protein